MNDTDVLKQYIQDLKPNPALKLLSLNVLPLFLTPVVGAWLYCLERPVKTDIFLFACKLVGGSLAVNTVLIIPGSSEP